MKIAVIGHKRIPSREGGIEVAVEELSVRMAARGHQVEAYNRMEDRKKEFPSVYRGIRIYGIPTPRHYAVNAFAYSVLAAACAVFRGYDVIHIHAEGPASMAWLPKLFGIPTVVTIHGLDWQRGKWGAFASRYLKLGERVAAGKADALIVLSEHMRQYFLETYGRESFFIRNGVSAPVFRKPDLIVRRWGLEEGSYLLFAARLVPEKGLHYLLDAFAGVRTEKKLVIAGKIYSDSAYIREICRKARRDPRVIMADFVEGGLLEELFSNSCLYVLPSDVEGMAMSLLEALSFGLPCLVSDIPENQRIADDYVNFFPKGNEKELRKAIQRLLDGGLKGFDREGQIRWMRERFGWDAAVEQTLSVYENVLKKRRKK